MNYAVPVVINDLHQTTVEYWSTIYHGFTAKLAAKTAIRVWKRCRLAEAQNWRCCWCGVRLTPTADQKNSATIEHITPRSLGGSDEMDNLAAACGRCNQRRKTKPVEVFLSELISSKLSKRHDNFTKIDGLINDWATQGIEVVVPKNTTIRVRQLKKRVDCYLVAKAVQITNDNPYHVDTGLYKLFERYKNNGCVPVPHLGEIIVRIHQSS